MRKVALALTILCAIAPVANAQPSVRIDADSVWRHPTDGAVQCGTLACIGSEMGKGYTPSSVMAASNAITGTLKAGYPFWVTKYVPYGPVDVAVVACGQCRVGRLLLVNGKEPFVDPLKVMPLVEGYLRRPEIGSNHPNAVAQRLGLYLLGATRLPDRGQRFTFAQTVGDCEACQPFAAIKFTIDFDPAGAWRQLHMLGPIGSVTHWPDWVRLLPTGVALALPHTTSNST